MPLGKDRRNRVVPNRFLRAPLRDRAALLDQVGASERVRQVRRGQAQDRRATGARDPLLFLVELLLLKATSGPNRVWRASDNFFKRGRLKDGSLAVWCQRLKL
jgi:hypothetical protein